jgi:hypothetical protein
LTIGDAAGPTQFVDAVSFGAAAPGESFGRTPNGAGRLYPAAAQTFGGENSLPRVGPLVMTEVMFAPGDPSAAALAIDPNLSRDNLEYVEVFNPTDAAVDLTAWRVRLGVDYDFDDGTQLASGQTLVVVPFDVNNAVRLSAFRAHYGLDETVAIVGGYNGQLSSLGDGIQLQRPGTPPANDPGFVPRLLEDEVIYDNIAPWPTDVAGGGRSLARIAANAYGNDPASWTSSDPSPGGFGGDVPGDLTGDGRLDQQDVQQLHQAALAGDLSADLTGNGVVDGDDLVLLVEDLMGSHIGDVDFDGVFNSHDIVLLFQQGEFEDSVAGNSTYIGGDWNLDGEFTSNDLLFALQRNGYQGQQQANPPAALAAVSHRAIPQTTAYDQIFAALDQDATRERRGDDPLDRLVDELDRPQV